MDIQEETLREIADNLETPFFRKLPSGRMIASPFKYGNISPGAFSDYRSCDRDYVSRIGNREFSRLAHIVGENLRKPIVLSSVDTSYEALCADKEIQEFMGRQFHFLHREVVLKDGFVVKNPTVIVRDGKFKYRTEGGTKVDVNGENAVETLMRAGVLQTKGSIDQRGLKIDFNNSGVSSISSLYSHEFFVGGDLPEFSSYRGIGLPELLKK